MPDRLVLVRHGHSEGNLAAEHAKRGDNSFYTPDFRERPGRHYHLTPEGIEQAQTAGQWILKNIGNEFDRYYVSPYVRTRETAGHLALPNADWRIDQRLRERDWGDIGGIPRAEFEDSYPQSAMIKRIDSLYWRPPGGESIADVRGLRVRSFFDTMHRECFGKLVIVVTHGEFMWATRAEAEYMSDEEWVEADKDPSQRIHNTQVHDYSRLDPNTGQQGKYIGWVRRVTPYMNKDSGWLPIKRHLLTNDQLLEQSKLA